MTGIWSQQSTWGGRTPFSSPAFVTKKRSRDWPTSTNMQQCPLHQHGHQQSADHHGQPQSKRVDRTPRRSSYPLQPPPLASMWFGGSASHHQNDMEASSDGSDNPGEWSTFAQELAECARSAADQQRHKQQQQQQQHHPDNLIFQQQQQQQQQQQSFQHHEQQQLPAVWRVPAAAEDMDMDNAGEDDREEEEEDESGSTLLFGAPS
eukprot:TRINITY_DN1087_c0_g1_i1.p1 TRINITY_DN1087_c0_g1~~TRINITY_DN1087_c0_g1_i1.p1  ORF type:complete len:206 (-),score=54.56 TRINITY_DN1087_c0_g1_i1:208-825(-)